MGDLNSLWEQAEVEQLAKRFLQKKSYPPVDLGELLSHLYLRAHAKFAEFNPYHEKFAGKELPLVKRFKIWLYFQMRASRLEIIRTYKAEAVEIPLIEEGDNGEEENEINHEEEAAYRAWIIAQFSVCAREVTPETIEECLMETIKLFSYAHDKPVRRIADALQTWWQFVQTNKREPTDKELANLMGVSCRTAVTAWSDARGQVRRKIETQTAVV